MVPLVTGGKVLFAQLKCPCGSAVKIVQDVDQHVGVMHDGDECDYVKNLGLVEYIRVLRIRSDVPPKP